MALLLSEYAPPETDIAHVLNLLVVHNSVEVYAGDHLVLAPADAAAVTELEAEAAERLFGPLPEDQRERPGALWRGFEAQLTAEARFARAIDALHPVLMTWGPGGKGLDHHTMTAELVLARKRPLLEPYPELWKLV